MNILQKRKRDLELAEYLCTIVGYQINGKPIYHTLEEAGVKFNLASSHVSRLKTRLIGPDVDGIRKIKDELSIS